MDNGMGRPGATEKCGFGAPASRPSRNQNFDSGGEFALLHRGRWCLTALCFSGLGAVERIVRGTFSGTSPAQNGTSSRPFSAQTGYDPVPFLMACDQIRSRFPGFLVPDPVPIGGGWYVIPSHFGQLLRWPRTREQRKIRDKSCRCGTVGGLGFVVPGSQNRDQGHPSDRPTRDASPLVVIPSGVESLP